MDQLCLDMHRRARHAKAVECTEAAEARAPGWTQRAYELLGTFSRRRKRGWIGEEFIYWSSRHGLKKPKDKRAFGSVFATAARRGVIRRIDWSTATRNSSAKPVWSRA